MKTPGLSPVRGPAPSSVTRIRPRPVPRSGPAVTRLQPRLAPTDGPRVTWLGDSVLSPLRPASLLGTMGRSPGLPRPLQPSSPAVPQPGSLGECLAADCLEGFNAWLCS